MSDLSGLLALTPKTHTLENGTRLTAVELNALHRAVLLARIRVGSLYEAPGNNGISHFLEHMLFRGTPEHPSAFALAKAFETLGGTLEGGTAEDHSVLSISVPPENLLPALELFVSVLCTPLLAEPEVEREIVREEILEGYDDQGNDVDATSLGRRLCFGEHPLGYPILGLPQTLDSFDQPGLKRHHGRHYTGANLALVAAGPVAGDTVLARAEHGLSGLLRGTTPLVEAPAREPAGRFGFRKHKASQTSLSVCYRAPGRQHPLEPATEMLLRILDDGMSTRVYHRICDELGLCYDAGAGYQAFDDVGVLEFGADTAHERAPRLLEVILELGKELASSGPELDELERARRRCRWQYRAMLDEPEALAHYYAYTSLMGAKGALSERCEALCDVTQGDLLAAAQAIFVPERQSVAAVGLGGAKQQARLEKLCGG